MPFESVTLPRREAPVSLVCIKYIKQSQWTPSFAQRVGVFLVLTFVVDRPDESGTDVNDTPLLRRLAADRLDETTYDETTYDATPPEAKSTSDSGVVVLESLRIRGDTSTARSRLSPTRNSPFPFVAH